MIRFKQGVFTSLLTPEIVRVLNAANRVYGMCGKNAIVTSLEDGQHSDNSLHYKQSAVDLRTRNLRATDKPFVASTMGEILGRDYDVVLEKSHLHVEFDPKEPL